MIPGCMYHGFDNRLHRLPELVHHVGDGLTAASRSIIRPPKNAPMGSLLVCFALFVLVAVVRGAQSTTPKRVFILDSYGRDVAPFNAAASAFRTTLAQELGEPVDLYEISLESGRFSDPGLQKPFVDFLVQRFAGRRLDLIVPIGAPAGIFALQNWPRLFPDTPVVVTAGDPRLVAADPLRTNYTLVTSRVNLPGMVEDILQLRPDTTNIAVIFGASPVEQFWEKECHREFAPFTNRVSFSWLSDLSLDQIRARVAALPARSFVLFGMMTVDAAGVPYDNDAALKVLHAAATAPLYGYFKSQLGLGIIGGRLYQDASVGAEGARVAIRILHGEEATSIAPRVLDPPFAEYDWRELKRWGISETRLPAGSIVRFRQPSAWDLYQGRIIAIGSVCVLEGALIVLLVINRAKRRRAEQALRESEERLSLAAAAANIGIWVWDIARNRIWATENWCRMFGFQPNAVISFATVIQHIHPDDRATVAHAVQRALDERVDYVGEYRVVLPAGTQRWIAARGRLDSTANAKQARMLGASMDITERRHAEEAARSLSGRLINAQEEERARLARELHDDITQRLARLAIDVARCELGTADPAPAITAQAVREGLTRLSEDVHALSYRLHPALLHDLGLCEALRAEAERFAKSEAIPVDLKERDLPDPVPAEAALCLFRVVQEALRNIGRHAQAHQVQISLRSVDGGLQLAVQDDGRGFDPAGERARPSLGLASMRERVHLLGGELDVESASGCGTTVVAWVPLSKGLL